jgi:hypothetical protein
LHGQLQDAGRFLGAAQNLLDSVGASLEPAEQDLQERSFANLRANLDEDTLAELIAAGREAHVPEFAQ